MSKTLYTSQGQRVNNIRTVMKTDDKHQLKVQKFFQQENIPVGCQPPASQPYVLHNEQVLTWGGGRLKTLPSRNFVDKR